MRGLLGCLFVFTSLSCSLVSGVPRQELSDWHAVTTADFELFSNAPRDELESFAKDLSRFVAVVEKTVRRERAKGRAEIYLLEGGAERRLIPHRQIGGLMAHDLSGFFGVVRGSGHRVMSRQSLFHEYAHFLTQRNSELDYPMWYLEGFAEFLAATRSRGDALEVGIAPIGRIEALAARRRDGPSIDLRAIISFEGGPISKFPPDFYAISWATVHYLNRTPELRARLEHLVELQSRGAHWRMAYARSFDIPIETLANRIEKHASDLSNGAPSTISLFPVSELVVTAQPPTRRVPPLEIARRLGLLSARRVGTSARLPQQAKAYFSTALAIDPEDPVSHASLARQLAASGDRRGALDHIAAVERHQAPGSQALRLAGEARLDLAEHLDDAAPEIRAEEIESAKRLFQRAIAADESDPTAHAGLGRTYLAAEAFREARQSLERAQALGEWDATLALDRGRMEARDGRYDEARGFLKRVARRGDPVSAEQANRLLAEIAREMRREKK